MTKKEEYEVKTEQLISSIVEENHFELVDIEYVKERGNWYLRAFIDKETGITVDDCELVSRKLSDLLDERDFISDSYILEISSPGLGRQLKKDKDYAGNLGEKIDLRLYKAKNRKKDFCGILKSFDKEKLVVELEDGIDTEFIREEIAIVKLALDF